MTFGRTRQHNHVMGGPIGLLVVAALLFVVSPGLAQSDLAPATMDRHGIKGEPVPLDSVDPDFSAYLERVRQLIKEHWTYPCMKNWKTGTCEYKSARLVVDFGMLRDGRVAFAEVRSSSGLAIYDDYAVNAVKGASPFPPVPPVLMARVERGSTGISIRVNFNYEPVTGVLQGFRVEAQGTRPVPIRMNGDVVLSDYIKTGDQSSATMALGGNAGKVTLTIYERSTVSLAEVSGRSTIGLESGKIDVAVVREGTRPSEAFDVRTPNATLNLDGTRATVEVAGGATKVCAVDGTFAFQPVGGARDEVRANQCVTIP